MIPADEETSEAQEVRQQIELIKKMKLHLTKLKKIVF